MYKLASKLIFKIDPESAHNCALFALRNFSWLIDFRKDYARLESTLLGRLFKNPVGLAAGFDKNAEVLAPLANLGFGFIEVGAITPKPQSGNPRPRIERLVSAQSIRNAMGFNNCGLELALINLARENHAKLPPVFINIGKNKSTPNSEAIDDYEILVRKLAPFADAFVINISSPNTPNLRDLQNAEFIKDLFSRLNAINKVPKFIKFAPDINFNLALDLAHSAIANNAAGVVLCNTTQDYSLCECEHLGGLSGKVLAEKSLAMLKALAPSIYGKGLIISSGGIFSGKDAYERIQYGANLVQIYTALIYRGPALARQICTELDALLAADGFSELKSAIGSKLRSN